MDTEPFGSQRKQTHSGLIERLSGGNQGHRIPRSRCDERKRMTESVQCFIKHAVLISLAKIIPSYIYIDSGPTTIDRLQALRGSVCTKSSFPVEVPPRDIYLLAASRNLY